MKSLTKKDFLFISVISLCFCASGGVLYHDSFFGNHSHNGVQVGTITYKNRYAEQKASGSALWSSISQNEPVYNRDTIRTGKESSAILHFNNKTEITLDEESMIYIKIDAEKTTVKLSEGSASIGNSVTSNPVIIQTNAGKVSVGGGTFQIRDEPGGVIIRTQNGKAEIRSSESEVPVTMAEGTSYDVTSATTKNSAIILTKPETDKIFVSSENIQSVVFSWKTQGTPFLSDDSELLVASDPAFSQLVYQEKKAKEETAIPLSEGKYYWKISGCDTSKSFTIIKKTAPSLISPINTVFAHLDAAVPIPFRWTKAGNADIYQIDIFRKNAPDKTILRRTINQRNTLFEFTEEGDYLWKVTALIDPGQIAFPSVFGSFSITSEVLTPPILVSPSGKEIHLQTTSASIAGKLPCAIWAPVPNADEYEITISSISRGKKESYKIRTQSNYLILDKDLPNGSYSVSARSYSKNKASAWSTPQELTVLPIQKMVPVLPVQDSFVTQKKGDLKFSWTDPNGGSHYRIIVSAIPSLDSAIIDKYVTGPEFISSLSKLTGSSIYWKVQLLDLSMHPITETPVCFFHINKKLDAPIPIFPILGVQLDLAVINNIEFKWKKETSPRIYTISLYRMTGGIRSPAGIWETTENRFILTNLAGLALDTFSWDLSSRTPESDSTTASSQIVTSYFRLMQRKTLAAPRIRRMTSKGEY